MQATRTLTGWLWKRPALFVGGWALAQLWLFRVAPLIGGALGGILYRWLSEEPSAQVTGVTPPATAGGDS